MEHTYHHPVMPELALYRMIGQDDQTAEMFCAIHLLLDQSIEALQEGLHICSSNVGDPLKEAFRLNRAIVSGADRAILQACGVLSSSDPATAELNDEVLWDRLTRIAAKKAKNVPLDSADTACRRYFHSLKCRATLDKLRTDWAACWDNARRQDRCENDIGFPIIDDHQHPLHIAHIELVDANGEGYMAEKVRPFLADRFDAKRIALYRRIACVDFTERYMRHRHEACMLGEQTVIATVDLKEKDCIGIYSGALLSYEQVGHSPFPGDFSRMMNVSFDADAKPTFLDGSGIIAKINTILEHDADGHATRQAEDGYNVRFVPFDIRLDDGAKIRLSAAFITAEILAGEELRVNYNYTPDFVAKLFRPRN